MKKNNLKAFFALFVIAFLLTIQAKTQGNSYSSRSPYFFNSIAIPQSYDSYREYRRFRFGITAGLFGSTGMGIIGGIEPAIRISDHFTFGTRVELTQNETDVSLSLGGSDGTYNYKIRSYTCNLTVAFGKRIFRPFLGIGYGFQFSEINVGRNRRYREVYNCPVFYPRIGFDLGHCQFIIDANIVKGKRVTKIYHHNINGVQSDYVDDYNVKPGYVSLKFGFFFGGGRIK